MGLFMESCISLPKLLLSSKKEFLIASPNLLLLLELRIVLENSSLKLKLSAVTQTQGLAGADSPLLRVHPSCSLAA
jgi:hypothetical protein